MAAHIVEPKPMAMAETAPPTQQTDPRRSELEFDSKLANPWRARTGYQPEGANRRRAVGDVTVRVHKLGVIEDVEELRAELERSTLRQFQILEQSDIPVIDSRSVEEPPVRSTQYGQCFRRES